jgi:hypothetical protein
MARIVMSWSVIGMTIGTRNYSRVWKTHRCVSVTHAFPSILGLPPFQSNYFDTCVQTYAVAHNSVQVGLTERRDAVTRTVDIVSVYTAVVGVLIITPD